VLPPVVTKQSRMSRASTNAVREAAAKVLAWDLFTAAGYCRTRAYVNVDKFERVLLSAVRQWKAVHANLTQKRRANGRSKP
jgi:hypothetical protein